MECTSFSQLAQFIKGQEKTLELANKVIKRRDEKVVGGIYKPKPIDRSAALLISKAPWYAYYHGKPKVKGDDNGSKRILRENKGNSSKREQNKESGCLAFQRENPNSKSKNCIRDEEYVQRRSMIMSKNDEPVEMYKGVELEMTNGHYSRDKINEEIIAAIQRNLPTVESKLARAAIDARSVIDEEMENIGQVVGDFERLTKDLSSSISHKRMFVVTECSKIKNALRDVRQFFLGPDYEREKERLKEFIELCERLKALKDSGFLDNVADTMIRLSTTDE